MIPELYSLHDRDKCQNNPYYNQQMIIIFFKPDIYDLFSFILSGVVMIRCDIHKGKLRLGNFIEPGRDAQPRKDEGFVIDHGNIGMYSLKHCFSPKIIVNTQAVVEFHSISGEIQYVL